MYLYIENRILKNLMFNIIITNKNNTATAPTYTIMNNKAKNSAPRITKSPETFKNTNIKLKIEYTGFLDIIITKERITDAEENE